MRQAAAHYLPILSLVSLLLVFPNAGQKVKIGVVDDISADFVDITIPPTEDTDSKSNRVLFTLKEGEGKISVSNKGQGCTALDPKDVLCDHGLLEKIESVQWCPRTNVLVVKSAAAADVDIQACLCADYGEAVLFMETDYKVKVSAETPPTLDPYIFNQWHLSKVSASGPPQGNAWDISQGTEEVIVAVIDTGVDYNHRDLASNMWINPGEIPGNGIDDDENGHVDDVYGVDFENVDSDPMDDQGHGTHCAGVIAAVKDNGVGGAGIAPNVKIMALKAMDERGEGFLSSVISAVEYSLEMGAHITSNSFGAPLIPPSPAFTRVLNAVEASGQLYVAAAGNDGRDADKEPEFPASLDRDIILSVTSTDEEDNLSRFSNFGKDSIDIAAPGERILSTAPNGKLAVLSGTSTSTPMVAGTAALILSAMASNGEDINGRGLEVKKLILESVDVVPGLAQATLTGGRLNSWRALSLVSPDAANPPEPAPIQSRQTTDPSSAPAPQPEVDTTQPHPMEIDPGRKMMPMMNVRAPPADILMESGQDSNQNQSTSLLVFVALVVVALA
ncbi:hypothetical protein BSKO_11349 [Bryopsis sp. KO-2023]|nr:hypothetical protein BSKO_11349 [Bryopsis sp. KO-2023]